MSLKSHQNFVARYSDIENRFEMGKKREEPAFTNLTGASGTGTEEKTITKRRFEDLDY